jgi:uncharacterized protein
MRYLVLLIIRLYWLIPKKKRKHCIFKETCSQYIYRITKHYGLQKSILAYKKRKLQCKAGYYYLTNSTIRLADGCIVSSSILREDIL